MGRTTMVAVVGLVVVSCSTSAPSSTAPSTTFTTRATTTTTRAPATTSTLPVEIIEARMDDLLEGAVPLEPSAVLYEATWGSGAGQVGLESIPESGEINGPCCFASTADTWVILDPANHRMIISQDGVVSSDLLAVGFPIGVGLVGDTIGIVGSHSTSTVDEFVFYSLRERRYTDRRSPGQGVRVSTVVALGEEELWFSVSEDDPDPTRSEEFWTTGLDDRMLEGWRRPLSNGWFVDADFRNYYTLIRLLDSEGAEMGRWKMVGQAYFLVAEPDEQGSLTALFTYPLNPDPMVNVGSGMAVVRLDGDGIRVLGLVPWVDEPKIWDAYELVDAHTLRMLFPDSDGVRLLEFRF